MKSKKAIKKDINFYARYLYDPKKEERKRLFLMYFGPVILLLVVALGTFTFFRVATVVTNDKIDEHDQFMTLPKNVEAYGESVQLDGERQELSAQYDALNQVVTNISSYPTMGSGILSDTNSAIGAAADITNASYDSANGVLILTVEASSADDIPVTVKRIKSTGLYLTVSYTGYEADGDNYKANIACVLKLPQQ
ncbi:MAG: hypothetical protein Q4C25_05740 [Bacillota bacterium]|nr:hypothetical protein [Bacillota bacterium]